MEHDNWVVVGGDGVLIEPEAVDQLARVAASPGCRCAVGLPDLHPGPGVPIGAAFEIDRVRPELVGSDAGCGVRLAIYERLKASGDALERRVREATDEAPLGEVDHEEALELVWERGPAGLASLAGVPEALAELAAREPELSPPGRPLPDEMRLCAQALGTIGGGNHFAELSLVGSVVDGAAASRLALQRGRAALVVHSGSRGLGRMLADRWVGRDPSEGYLAELEGCVRFARANRLVIGWQLAAAAGVGRADKLLASLDVVHNTVVPSAHGFVHRKGAAPAGAGELTVVLGSRGAPSWVLQGTGAGGTLDSVAHGAGRKVTRGDAKGRLRSRYKRAELSRTEIGSRVICDDTDLLYEEHPECYKAIEPVVDALVSRAAATRVASLVPQLTVKR